MPSATPPRDAPPLLPLQRGLAYGPVRSRRLGASLGLNILPDGGKLCTFDCAYCQYGWTRPELLAGLPAARFPSPDEIVAAVERALRAAAAPPDFLTFSGNGEPTLHPAFGAVVEGLARLRDRLAPRARIALLSNASTLSRDEVRAALPRIDVPILKLDAGTEEAFRRFCRPLTDVRLDEIVAALRALRGVTLQALFCDGPDGNASAADVAAWAARVLEIAPDAVQVYTVARGYPSRALAPVAPGRLREIGATLAPGAGIRVEVF